MPCKNWKLVFTHLVLTVGCIGILPSAAAQNYTIQNLGTLGGNLSVARDINHMGNVAGSSEYGNGRQLHSFFWTADRERMTDLGTFGGISSAALGINNFDQVVGTANIPANQGLHAFLWEKGNLADLGTLGGTYSRSIGINDKGQMVGSSAPRGVTPERAVLWENGQMTDLGTLGGSSSVAWAINDRGQVVGWSQTSGNASTHAFLWEQGRMKDLGTLGGTHSYAYGINNLGQVVGYSSTTGNMANRAFLWEQGWMTDLGTLGGRNSMASGINNLGQVTGQAETPLQHSYAVCWDSSGMKDLSSLIPSGSGWQLLLAACISDGGEIAGEGKHQLRTLAYRLSPAAGKVLTEDEVQQARQELRALREHVQQLDRAGGDSRFLHLIQNLTAAEAHLASGKTAVSSNLIQAFVNQVNALTSSTGDDLLLAPTDGQRWIAAAQPLLARLRP